ncbi:MAG: cyclic nucleotide-binding domain-containing protein [Geminicoccaceae bacterium]|nr:cyclic nucleotide-binding domain-containing protein [Geminicoccaceae bacterium]
MRRLDEIIKQHPFFSDFEPACCEMIAGCGRNVRFGAGQYLFREGGSADRFYLIRHGRVAFETTVPGREPVRILTLDPGDIAGVSWLVPPYRWNYDARALEPTGAIALDATCLRGKCEDDHHLGYELMKRFVPELVRRLHAARMQMLDVYGKPAA